MTYNKFQKPPRSSSEAKFKQFLRFNLNSHKMVKILKQDLIPLISSYYQKQLGESTYQVFLFSQKYQCNFEEFEKKTKEAKDENFEEWDDYIAWKGHRNSLKHLSTTIEEIENGFFSVA
jgi:hypothetical protein